MKYREAREYVKWITFCQNSDFCFYFTVSISFSFHSETLVFLENIHICKTPLPEFNDCDNLRMVILLLRKMFSIRREGKGKCAK